MPGTDPLARREFLIGISVVSIGAGCSESIEAPAPRVAATPEIAVIERKMHELVNRDRAAHGKAPLAYDDRLADTARAHAADMRDNRFFSHESPKWGSLDDRIARAKISVAVARENLAEAIDVDEAERSLMKSPGHFENLMADDVTHVGVGIVTGGVEHPNMLLFVQVFARTVNQETPAEAKAVVLAKITKARAANGKPAPTIHPVLDELAQKYVEEVDDSMDPGALDKLGVRVLADVKDRGAGLSVVVSGQRAIAASEYEPSALMTDKTPLSIGIGAAPAKDERGRPAVKILVLVGA
ncbi:MAG: CAP domain-containing protein [Polyangiaceae bacterium]|nr:CAP domain-containing protein [Polyangiaceae bacterium]